MKRRRTFVECFCEAIVDIITYPIKEIRDICEKPTGYLKLAQLVIIFFALGGFGILLLYTLFFDKDFIDPNIFMTVIVGLIGTIVGMFFSESAMRQIELKKEEAEQKVKKKEFDLKSLNRLIENQEKMNVQLLHYLSKRYQKK